MRLTLLLRNGGGFVIFIVSSKNSIKDCSQFVHMKDIGLSTIFFIKERNQFENGY